MKTGHDVEAGENLYFLFLGVLFVRTGGGFSPRVAHESRELN